MRLTSLAAIMLLLCILFSLSSCEVEDIGRIGRGIITGQKVDKYRAPEIVPNDKNFVVVEGQEGQSVMKYTLTSAYETDDISKAGCQERISGQPVRKTISVQTAGSTMSLRQL